MKHAATSLLVFLLASPAFAETMLPTRETGKGETVETFINLCVKPETSDFRSHVKLVQKSGWTVFYEDAVGKGGAAYEASASSNPGDECSMHLTLEEGAGEEKRCEVVVSRFCSASRTSLIRASVMDELQETKEFAFDPVSTSDENRRMSEHEHHVYRSVTGDGPLVRLADTGGSLFLSAVSLARTE